MKPSRRGVEPGGIGRAFADRGQRPGYKGTLAPSPPATARRAQWIFPDDLRALRRARPNETDHAQCTKNGGDDQPAAGLRDVKIRPPMAHAIRPTEEKREEGQ